MRTPFPTPEERRQENYEDRVLYAAYEYLHERRWRTEGVAEDNYVRPEDVNRIVGRMLRGNASAIRIRSREDSCR